MSLKSCSIRVTGMALTLAAAACTLPDMDPVASDWTVSTHVEDWRDEVIYQLLTDRFSNGDPRNDLRIRPDAPAAYHGGDFQGVIDKLPYLEELGVTALWISPIIRNVDTDSGVDGYHGYWAQDFTRLNPHFGDLAIAREMVRQAHARGIKVILDIVTNHVGQVFFYDINGNGLPDESVMGSGSQSPLTRVSEYDPDYNGAGIQGSTSLGGFGPAPIVFLNQPEIFRVPPWPAIFQNPAAYNRRGRVTNWNDRDQVVYGDFPGGLKDLNTENPQVRDALVDVYVDWALKLDLDGFRIDTIKHVEMGFWEEFAPRVRQRLKAAGKEKFILFGEAFDGDDGLIGSYTQAGRLDSVFYFSQQFQVMSGVFQHGGPTRNIESLLASRRDKFGSVPQPDGIGVAPQQALVNFIDNHDIPRFLYGRPDPSGTKALRAALAYLLTEDGIPCLYYGTEQDYAGGNDPMNREDLSLSDFRTDGETFRWVQRLTRLRRSYEALRRGTFELRWTTPRTGDEQDAGIVAFERKVGDRYALVVINANGGHPSETSATQFGGGDMTVSPPAGTVLVNVLGDAATGSDATKHVVGNGGALKLTVPSYGVMVLVPESQVAR